MASIPVFNKSISLADNPALHTTKVQRGALAAFAVGVLGMIVALFSETGSEQPILTLSFISVFFVGGALVYIWDAYAHKPAGIKNDGIMFSSNQARGLAGWVTTRPDEPEPRS